MIILVIIQQKGDYSERVPNELVYSKKNLVLWKTYLVSGTAWFRSAKTPNHSLEAHTFHRVWLTQ